MSKKKPSKATTQMKAAEPEQPPRTLVYTGPPLPDDERRKLKEAFSRLPSHPPLVELDRTALSRLDHSPALAPLVTAAPSPVKSKHAGGRPPSFTPKQTNRLQQEQHRYEKQLPGKLKKDVERHLQNWAKDKLDISASLGTIRAAMAKTKN
ncbi:hypothetical protein AB7M17_003949 [Bradyrhizobium sp. USDA 377]